MWLEVLGALVAVVAAAYGYNCYKHSYWSRCGVPTAPNLRPLFGHILSFIKAKNWLEFDKLYKNRGGNKVMGLYELLTPGLVVCDPELVKAVLVKDFDYFIDRRAMKLTTERDEIFNELLTATCGDHWRGIRSVLSPSFTSGRLKTMFPLVEDKADLLVDYINREIKANPSVKSVKLKKTFGTYALDVISSVAFGMETNSLASDGKSLFNQKVEAMVATPSKWKYIKMIIFVMAPWLLRVLKISISEPQVTFFKETVEEAIIRREKGEKRDDFLGIMMEAREEQKDATAKTPKYKLENKTVVANCFLFILAGYDTTSSTLSLVAFMVARHGSYQERLREELKEIITEHETLTYQGVMEAKLLDAVFNETLRMYPPAHVTQRQCTKDYRFPDHSFTVAKGTMITVPIWSLHHEDMFWHAPGTFWPERFFPQNKDKIVSGTYLPFGLGPRNCIAMRFALMEAKLALAKVILSFELHCVAGEEELQMDPSPGLLRCAPDTRIVFTPIA